MSYKVSDRTGAPNLFVEMTNPRYSVLTSEFNQGPPAAFRKYATINDFSVLELSI